MAVAVVAATSEFSLELRGGETDGSNTDDLLVLEDALAVFDASPMFGNMVREREGAATPHLKHSRRYWIPELVSYEPLCECHEVRNLHRWVQSLMGGHAVECKSKSAAALGGGATIGKHLFAEPTPYPGALHVAASPQESALDHTGAWRCVSPEELHHAMIFGIADAVQTQHNNQ